MKVWCKETDLKGSRLGVARPIASIDLITVLVGLDIRADFFDDTGAIATKDGREREAKPVLTSDGQTSKSIVSDCLLS